MSVPIDSAAGTRYAVTPATSSLAFEARSTLHSVHGTAADLSGFIEVTWSADGTFVTDSAPKMHVEFPVESLRTGNGLQDREMWKVVDSKRFPRVAGDLRDLPPASTSGTYAATGDITLAGRSRQYQGELTFTHEGDGLTIDGEVSVDIRDFGLKPPSLLMMKVDPVVQVRLHLVATKVP